MAKPVESKRTNYAWAVNKVKLAQSWESALIKKSDPTEEDVKAEYVLRAGLLAEDKVEQDEVRRPRVTANKGQKISVKE